MSTSTSMNPFQISRKKLGAFIFQGYALPVYEWPQRAIHPEPKIMRAMMDCLTEIFSQSTKVLVLRFDLHVKEHSESNQVISQFSQTLASTLKKQYPGTWFHLIWVREHGRCPKQHYHCVLMANGQKIQHPAKLIPMIGECWQTTCGGTFSLPSNSYYFWKRDDNHLLGLIIYRISYLAKNITKRRFNIKTRRYGHSCIAANCQQPTQPLSVLLGSK